MGGGTWPPPCTVNAAVAVRIRAARADDLDPVHAIEVASFSDPWRREAFRDLILGGSARVVVAVTGKDSVVGYAVSYAAADEAEIANVAVSPAARRGGVGGALVDHVLADIRARGALTAFLEVRASNSGALALYASRGFTEVGRRAKYYQSPDEDAVLMRAALGSADATGSALG